jgi:hypothetical protein
MPGSRRVRSQQRPVARIITEQRKPDVKEAATRLAGAGSNDRMLWVDRKPSPPPYMSAQPAPFTVSDVGSLLYKAASSPGPQHSISSIDNGVAYVESNGR